MFWSCALCYDLDMVTAASLGNIGRRKEGVSCCDGRRAVSGKGREDGKELGFAM